MPELNSSEFDRLYQENLARLRPKTPSRKASPGAVKVMKALSGEVDAAPPAKAAKPKATKAATPSPSPVVE